MHQQLTPPAGMTYLGAPVTGLTQAPDGRWYVKRLHAATVLAHAEDLPGIELATREPEYLTA